MAKSENDHGSRPEPWKKNVDDLLARRKVNAALRLLDKVINNRQALLFEDDSWLANQRRLAWLYSCAELTFIVDEAARRALTKRRPISTQDLMAELAGNPSTTTTAGDGKH